MSATPLLDREQPLPGSSTPAKAITPEEKKNRRRAFIYKRLWNLAFGALAGVILIWGLPGLPFLPAPAVSTPIDAAVWLAAVNPALYVSIWINVLGVVVAAYANRFALRHVSMAGFLLERQAHGWRLRFALRRIFSASASTATLSREHLMRRYVRMMLGGPAATIGLLLTAWLALPKGIVSYLLVIINLGLTVYFLIPFTIRGTPSPAKLVLILARKDAAADRLNAILQLLAIDAQGIRPSAWPREMLERIGVPAKGDPLFWISLAFRYAVARDANDTEAIAEALESGLALVQVLPPDTRRWYFSTAACFQASFRHQIPLAEAWLESAGKVKNTYLNQDDWDSEAKGMIALAKGDAGAAQELLTRYLERVDQRPLPLCGMLVAERDRVLTLLHQFAGVEETGAEGA